MSKYLLATYTIVPKNKNITHTKGYWSNKENAQYDEQVLLVNRLKNSDLDKSGIILNLEEEKIVKNRMSPTANYIQIYEYFKKNFPNELKNI